MLLIKSKTEKKHIVVGTIPKSNIKIAERGKIDTITGKYMTAHSLDFLWPPIVPSWWMNAPEPLATAGQLWVLLQTFANEKRVLLETLEKTEGAVKNRHSRETGNIGYTRHRTKTNKNTNTHNTENWNDQQHRP